MNIFLYDTRTGTKREFAPIRHPITMYVCGPTVYDTPHIGNARPAIVFDMLYRLLRYDFGAPGEENVIYARNYTDVDDKIIARAKERGITIGELCEETIATYEAIMADLAVLEPTIKPRATETILEMESMIATLIDLGFAYESEGHVFFDNEAFTRTYGEAARLTRPQEERGNVVRIEPSRLKRHQSDFVLWKPAGDKGGWASRWGEGRPGWHIECSAMIAKHLGVTINIHGGGQDLIFPHHEAECAQSHAAMGQPLADFWVHNGMVLVDGRKMSKSDGNFITVADVQQRHPGIVLRFAMLMTHYHQPYDFTWGRLDEAKATLSRLFNRADEDGPPSWPGELDADVMAALRDDLNTPLAIQRLHQARPSVILETLRFMGIERPDRAPLANFMEALLDERDEARKNKDWKLSDTIRDELRTFGITVEDGPQGTKWKWTNDVY